MSSYQEVDFFIKTLFPTLRKTRARNLALLTYGILQRRTLCLSQIARALPLPIAHIHKLKRLWRLLNNSELLIPKLFPPLAGLVLNHRPRGSLLPVLLDYTGVKDFHILFAGMAKRHRALPLCFQAFRYNDLMKSQNLIEEAFIRRIKELLPPQISAVLIADRGFGRANLFLFLSKVGFNFVIRVKGDVIIEDKGQRLLLEELRPRKTEVRWLKGVKYRQDGLVKVNIAMIWRGKEPWYLVTNLSNPQEAIRLYRKRMGIEEMFRDLKTYLGMERASVHNRVRLHRLLLGLVLAYLLLALVGLQGLPKGWKRVVLTKGKASFIWLALELFTYLSYIPNAKIPLFKRQVMKTG